MPRESAQLTSSQTLKRVEHALLANSRDLRGSSDLLALTGTVVCGSQRDVKSRTQFPICQSEFHRNINDSDTPLFTSAPL